MKKWMKWLLALSSQPMRPKSNWTLTKIAPPMVLMMSTSRTLLKHLTEIVLVEINVKYLSLRIFSQPNVLKDMLRKKRDKSKLRILTFCLSMLNWLMQGIFLKLSSKDLLPMNAEVKLFNKQTLKLTSQGRISHTILFSSTLLLHLFSWSHFGSSNICWELIPINTCTTYMKSVTSQWR